MSFIDTGNHELCGFLANVPLYHPLATYDGGKGYYRDFSATPDNLVLGGGSGENAAAVANVKACVGSFLSHYDAAENDFNFPPSSHSFKVLQDTLKDKKSVGNEFLQKVQAASFSSGTSADDELLEGLNGIYVELMTDEDGDLLEPIDFSLWPGELWYDFINAAKAPVALMMPFTGTMTVESWTAAAVGEYALIEMTDLVVSLVPNLDEELIRSLAKMASNVPLFRAVLTYPSGYKN